MKKSERIRSIILMTLLGCIICIACAFIIAWIGDRYAPKTYVLANDIVSDKSEKAESVKTESEKKNTQVLLPQWIFYQSVGSNLPEEEKTYLDVLVNRWTKGKLTDDELGTQMTDYLEKRQVRISTMGVQSEALCVFPSVEELPDYTQMLTNSNKSGLYDFIGVYTNGEYDEEGRLICYYWEAGVMGA
jgi:hypothetical protein